MNIKRKNENVSVYENLDFANAVIIGFMMGIYEVMGKGGAQAIINMAGQYVGREILRFAADKGTPITSMESFRAFAIEHNLVGDIDFYQTGDAIFVRLASCKTCPKKVGHYEFDGTACPWGGTMAGMLNQILPEQYSFLSHLVPGEECVLELKRVK